jgi:predicted nuclease of restriction endonuclease-like (RecB) superfamily
MKYPISEGKGTINTIDTKIYQAIRETLVTARTKAYAAINFAMVEAYWNIGRQIAEAQGGRESVKNEIQTLEPKTSPDYILKDPYILEFLDLKENKDYHESDLEQALIDKLQDFLL